MGQEIARLISPRDISIDEALAWSENTIREISGLPLCPLFALGCPLGKYDGTNRSPSCQYRKIIKNLFPRCAYRTS